MENVIQPIFEISDLIKAGLATGKFVRTGGVIRDAATGKIVEILKDAISKESVNATQDIVDSVSKTTDVAVVNSTTLALGKNSLLVLYLL